MLRGKNICSDTKIQTIFQCQVSYSIPCSAFFCVIISQSLGKPKFFVLCTCTLGKLYNKIGNIFIVKILQLFFQHCLHSAVSFVFLACILLSGGLKLIFTLLKILAPSSTSLLSLMRFKWGNSHFCLGNPLTLLCPAPCFPGDGGLSFCISLFFLSSS